MSTMLLPQAPYRPTATERDAFRAAYLRLLVERRRARGSGPEPGHHGLPLSELRALRVGDAMLLWMLYQGHVCHLLPQPAHGDPKLHPVDSLILRERSHFALTLEGEEAAVRLSADDFPLEETASAALTGWPHSGRLLPRYDLLSRSFFWGRHCLKCFRQPSFNQEVILAAAEELRWPSWFDDPLPRARGINPKVRLHDTIKALNRHQNPYLLHFKGDGTGRRLGWEYR
jgi:hypothetical protein